MKSKARLLAAAMSLLMICGSVSGCKGTSERPVIEVSSTGGESSTGSSAASSAGSSAPASSANQGSSAGSSSTETVGVPSSTESVTPPESSEPPFSSSSTVLTSSTASVSTSSSVVPPISSSTITSSTTSSSVSTTTTTTTVVSTPSMSSSEKPVPPEDLPDDPIQRKIVQMSLKERVYQLFFVTPEQLGGRYPVLTAIDLSQKPVGGVLCMGANLQTVSQTRTMLSGTQANAMKNGIGVFLAVDEEGGLVARCAKNLGTTAFYGMATYGARNDAAEAFNIGKTIGTDIKSLGFNVDFAPVADVNIHPNNELGNRIFSDDPNVVSNMVSNVVKGLNSAGVCATLKHFPGLGAEDGNTHTATSIIIDRTYDQLRGTEFVPFKGGIEAGADFVMVGHQQVTAFGDGLPADLSYTAVTKMLRGELGFNGIAITDAQNMNTISGVYYSRTAAKMSINAGIDMILAPYDLDDAVNGVLAALQSGEITEERLNESVARILTVKQKMGLLN